mgnify:FL=1|jgi:hypothetical protein|tara:strand:- start:528 stop:821 length:294 start_codon:yes stop_codon:yes gene_type:complete
MTVVDIPLVIMKSTAAFTLVIMFYFYKIFGKAPNFFEVFSLIFNFSGMIYIAYGMSTNNIFMFRGGLLLVTVSYGIFVSYYLERMGERKTEKDEKKK